MQVHWPERLQRRYWFYWNKGKFVCIDMTDVCKSYLNLLFVYIFMSVVSVGFCHIRDHLEARATEDILVMKVDRCVALLLMFLNI